MRSCLWFIIILFTSHIQLYSLYRPYDIYRPSTSSLAKGGVGVSDFSGLGDLVLNPALVSSIKSGGIIFALDGKTRISRLQSDFSIQPQYIPILNVSFSLNENSGAFLGTHSPFQRIFQDTFFITYFWEAGYGYRLHPNLHLGATLGAVMGVEARSFVGWGFSGSFGLYSPNEYANMGLFFRIPSGISYSNFSQGIPVTERTPAILRYGISKKLGIFTLSFELEYIFWRNSSFKEFGVEKRPAFQAHFLDFLHPHLGSSVEFSDVWPGLIFSLGLYTEDYFDFEGKNERQILLSLGVSATAYSDYWGDRLKINFAYVSSSLLSLFWDENNQIETFQIALQFFI